jgi:hypothetical protein
VLDFFYTATGRVKMKTFTISAIAFYFFYVLNGLMAPTHAQRAAGACTDVIAGIDGVKTSMPKNCKRDALVAQQVANAVPNN